MGERWAGPSCIVSSPRDAGAAGLGAAWGAEGEPGLVLTVGGEEKQEVGKDSGWQVLSL